MGRTALISLLVVACIASCAYSAEWGYNGTMVVTDASLFPLTVPVPEGTHVKVSKPFLDQSLWVVSYFRPEITTAQRFRVDVWNIVLGDAPTNNISAAFAHPDRIRSMVEWSYTQPGSGLTFANVIVAGGEGSNGVKSSNVIDLYTYSGGVGIDTSSFPTTLPEPRSGGIVTTDSTAALLVDTTSGIANASVYIFGGELDSGYTNETLKLHTPPGAAVPTGWEVVELNPESPVPEPRGDMAAIEVRGKWYMFGGRNSTTVFGDLWVFDFAELTWTKLSDFGAVAIDAADDPSATAVSGTLPKLPPARYGHSMVFISGANPFSASTEYIVMSGGTNSHSFFNDWWVFDPTVGLWESFQLPAETFAPRAWLGLLAHHNEPYVYVWGGNDSTTVFNDLWTINMTFAPPIGPGFRALPNNIIAGVAGGILLVLIITVVVLKITDRNRN